MNLSLDDREKIFAKVCRLVREKHFNPALNGTDWEQLIVERRDEILKAENAAEFRVSHRIPVLP